MFSKTCEYAIKIMIYLSFSTDKKQLSGVKEISEAIDSPESFTAKILQQLVKTELLHSVKGKKGGFRIDKKIEEIKIRDIVQIIDGNKLLDNCLLGLKGCSNNNPCPLHHKFKDIKAQIESEIFNSTLKDIDKYLMENKINKIHIFNV